MRWLLVLVLLLTTRLAHAEGDSFALYGLGTSMANNTSGWAFRAVRRIDFESVGSEEKLLIGVSVGLDTWRAGDPWGLSFPLGWYAGAEVKDTRMTIGVGLGLWTFEKVHGEMDGGISPYANTTIEKTLGKLMLVLDCRITRQVIETEDHNVYSVILMAGRRTPRM